MNILSSEQMKIKEAQLLQIYQRCDLKFKFSFNQLLQAKQSGRNLFCFKKAKTRTDVWIQKLVPLHKSVQILDLEQQQNGIFKVLVFVFLFIIYKPKHSLNHFVLEHLKCSLYSDDINLLDINNHSFNKKIKSDTIKAVLATFFNQMERLIESEANNSSIIKIQHLLAFAMQKNDMIVEGFHLFYRSILTKFDVEGANNCIQEVNPEQAIENLIEYFEIECRIFNDLYLFPESGVFLAKIQENIMFGRYYENELYFQETSQEQVQPMPKLSFSQEKGSQNMFLVKSEDILEKNDVKIFNLLLDTDRSSEQNFIGDKIQEAATPCFEQNDEIKLGKKKDRNLDKGFNKLKNRMQNQKINEILSEQEEIQLKNQEILGTNKTTTNNFDVQNMFLNLGSDDNFSDNDAAETPMLGGAEMFDFGKKGQESFLGKKNQNLIVTNDIKMLQIKSQSYQDDNSSQSNCSQKLKNAQIKNIKNQMKSINGTSSQTNLIKLKSTTGKIINDEFRYNKKQNNFIDQVNVSFYSNCTCHIQKRNRMKLNSQILSVLVPITDKQKPIDQKLIFEDSGQKFQTQLVEQMIRKQKNQQGKKLIFKDKSNKSAEKLMIEKKPKSPVYKQLKEQVKSPEFLSFLRKDKSQLIKKLTDKRIAKQSLTGGEFESQNNLEDAQNKKNGEKRFVKQSMFVGSYNLQNPERFNHKKAEQHNRSMTPNSLTNEHRGNDRQRTPKHRKNDKTESSEVMNLFKVSIAKSNNQQAHEINKNGNYRPQVVINTFNSQPGSHATLNMTAQKHPTTLNYNQNTTVIKYVNKVPTVQVMGGKKPVPSHSGTGGYEFYFKK